MFRRLGLVTAISLSILATPSAPASAASPRPVAVAHRGASAYAPENTLAAVRLAAELDADMFEVDVQETRDHQLVLMHDTTLARTTDAESVFPGRAPWRVADFTLAEIRRLDAGSWFGAGYGGERVPTLGETLRAMRDRGPGLLLEVKAPHLYPGVEERVAAELRRHPAWLAPGRLVVQSFDWESMRAFHRVMPQVPVGLLGTPSPGRLPALAEFAAQVNPPHHEVTAAYVRRVRSLGMRVFTWTVDDPDAMRRQAALPVDGIITNRPDVLRGVLGGAARRDAA